MDTLLITLTNSNQSFSFDIEYPSHITVGKFKEDLHEALNAHKPDLYIRPAVAFELYCNRLGVRLNPERTLREEGIWNGDIITMTED